MPVLLDVGILDKGVVGKVVGVERHNLGGNASQWVSLRQWAFGANLTTTHLDTLSGQRKNFSIDFVLLFGAERDFFVIGRTHLGPLLGCKCGMWSVTSRESKKNLFPLLSEKISCSPRENFFHSELEGIP